MRLRSLCAFLIVAACTLTLPCVSFAQVSSAQRGDSVQLGPKDFEKGGGEFVRQRMDWEYKQRAYPHKQIPAGARMRALKQLDAKRLVRPRRAPRFAALQRQREIFPRPPGP